VRKTKIDLMAKPYWSMLVITVIASPAAIDPRGGKSRALPMIHGKRRFVREFRTSAESPKDIRNISGRANTNKRFSVVHEEGEEDGFFVTVVEGGCCSSLAVAATIASSLEAMFSAGPLLLSTRRGQSLGAETMVRSSSFRESPHVRVRVGVTLASELM
jgi:hypothetical protein